MSSRKEEMKFTKNQHEIWHDLITRQNENVQEHACSLYLKGSKSLRLPRGHIPTLHELNREITPRTSWHVMRTTIRYSDTSSWYQHFARREFIITNYLRSREEFEFTPEPDMFHDIFGHLPYFTQPEYTEIMDMFTHAYFHASDEQREDLKKLAWFSYEFGLIEEKGNLKAFGTGLISSIGELKNAISGSVPLAPFTIDNVLKKNKAIASFNQQLFVFPSLENLKETLSKYFATCKEVERSDVHTLEDKEMDLSKYV